MADDWQVASEKPAPTPPPGAWEVASEKPAEQAPESGFWSGVHSALKSLVPDTSSVVNFMKSEVNAGRMFIPALAGSAAEESAKEGIRRATRPMTPDKGIGYRAANAASPLVPGLNPESMEARAERGDTSGILGEAAVPATLAAAPQAAELAGEVIPKGTPERLYQSALKPSTTLPTSKVASIVKTGLQNEIPVSEAGVEKIGALIDDLNQKIATKIQGSPATVNKFAVTSRLGETAQEFGNQVNPAKDLGAISRSGNEFLKNQPSEIPASQAQAIKQGTYQQISKSYGQLSNATIESQKALARGIKEELASQIPEIGDLNAKESQLIGLDKVLERAVRRINNQQMMGIGTPIAAGAAGAITKSSGVAAAAGFLKAIVDDPMVKSKLAIAMARKSNLGEATIRLKAYSAALASAAAQRSQSSEEGPSQ